MLWFYSDLIAIGQPATISIKFVLFLNSLVNIRFYNNGYVPVKTSTRIMASVILVVIDNYAMM